MTGKMTATITSMAIQEMKTTEMPTITQVMKTAETITAIQAVKTTETITLPSPITVYHPKADTYRK